MNFGNIIKRKIILKSNHFYFLFFFLFTFITSSCQLLVKPIAGDFNNHPEKLNENSSELTKKLIDNAFTGLENKCMVDYHVHAVGVGAHSSGNWVNPNMSKFFNFYSNLQYNVYMSASGIKSYENADQEYLERLVKLIRAEKRYGKVILFAFDYFYDKQGNKNLESSTFYISNQYVWDVYQKYPNEIIPAVSVHPYKKNAAKELEDWAKKGVRFIKWLPNSQHIDPADKDIIPYYNVMKKYNMVLISHTGHEKAVHGEEYQKLGNPSRFILPLDMGVKVVMAHMATLGDCIDHTDNGKIKSCFEVFWGMFKNKKYSKNLFGEMSGTTIYTRMGYPIDLLMEHPELQDRIVNGSDYPLPAINILYRTSQYHKLGYITEEEREALNQVYQHNPLLFDFVVKRTIKHPKKNLMLEKKSFYSDILNDVIGNNCKQ